MSELPPIQWPTAPDHLRSVEALPYVKDVSELPQSEQDAMMLPCDKWIWWWLPHLDDKGNRVEAHLAFAGKNSGVRKRWEIQWHRNGKVHWEQEFLHGVEGDGVNRSFYDNGQIKHEIHLRRGKAIGASWEWHKNGEIKTRIDENKHTQQCWDDSGTPLEADQSLPVTGTNWRLGL